jgi:hypothetical protein
MIKNKKKFKKQNKKNEIKKWHQKKEKKRKTNEETKEEQKYKNKNKSNIQMHKDTNENKNASMIPKWFGDDNTHQNPKTDYVTNTHPCNTGSNQLPMGGALVGVESHIIHGIIAHEV